MRAGIECQKCDIGTVIWESDMYGSYLVCLQCGFVIYRESEDEIKVVVPEN